MQNKAMLVSDDPKDFVANYELNSYKYSDFWKGRQYEHQSEVYLLTRLLKKYLPDLEKRTVMDLGGAYGRLLPLFAPKAKQVVLADYSTHELLEGLGNIITTPYKQKVTFLALNAYKMPLKDGSLDSLLSVRVMHHLKEMPLFIEELSRVLVPGGVAIIEFANKNHILALFRNLLHIRSFLGKGVVGVKHNTKQAQGIKEGQIPIMYNFAPSYMKKLASKNGLKTVGLYACSFFRFPLVKKIVPQPLLLGLEKLMQRTFGWVLLTPSIFIVIRKKGQFVANTENLRDSYICPTCHEIITEKDGEYKCKNRHSFPQEKIGIVDLRDPRPESVTF